MPAPPPDLCHPLHLTATLSAPLPTQCFAAAGLPPGLINVVTGRGSEIGDYLTTHPLVNCISFTGGDTGLDIARKAGMVPYQVTHGHSTAATNNCHHCFVFSVLARFAGHVFSPVFAGF